jgi:hypothetical protein
VRLFVAGGVMIGFLSHLVLDELYSVDFMGVGIRLNKYAGSALKLASPSRMATLATYVLLAGLAYLAWNNYQSTAPAGWHWNQLLEPRTTEISHPIPEDRRPGGLQAARIRP